jgi:hypothetical protein
MRFSVRDRSFGDMRRLPILTLVLLLLSATVAEAKGLSVTVPPEGQVAVAVASGAKSVKVKSAPAGVTVAGGVKQGRLAVAVVRPRGVTASGKVVFTVKGRVKGVKTFAKALDGGKAPGCGDLAKRLAKRLKGAVDMKALAPVLAAKLCGKSAPAGAAGVLSKAGLGPASAPGPAGPAPSGGGTLTRPGGTTSTGRATPTPTPRPGGGGGGVRVCDDGVDNDGDGQTDWEDPGCSDAGDTTEDSEVPVSAECAASSGVGMADDPTWLGAGINAGCGTFTSVEVDVAPGIATCSANNGFECTVFDPIASATRKAGATDMVDIDLHLKAPVDCSRPATIAFFRPNGEVAELRAPVHNCKNLPAPPPQCRNGADDDGDGLVDSRDAAGVTDPDPGCGSKDDTTEASEVPTPESCEVQIGVFGGDKTLTGLLTSGCGVLKGAWFRPPGNAASCQWGFSTDEFWTPCGAPLGGTVGVTFPATNQDLALAAKLTAEFQCRSVTVALVKENDTVMSDTVPFCG